MRDATAEMTSNIWQYRTRTGAFAQGSLGSSASTQVLKCTRLQCIVACGALTATHTVLQCVQCVAVCCSATEVLRCTVLQCVVVCGALSATHYCVAVCCSATEVLSCTVLQCIVVCCRSHCNTLQHTVTHCNAL